MPNPICSELRKKTPQCDDTGAASMTVAGFEPATCCSGGNRSIQLSYTARGSVMVTNGKHGVA